MLKAGIVKCHSEIGVLRDKSPLSFKVGNKGIQIQVVIL